VARASRPGVSPAADSAPASSYSTAEDSNGHADGDGAADIAAAPPQLRIRQTVPIDVIADDDQYPSVAAAARDIKDVTTGSVFDRGIVGWGGWPHGHR